LPFACRFTDLSPSLK